MARLARGDHKRMPTRARGRPNSATVAQIDREILQAARDLFLRHGFERTSMAMVTDLAGVSKTTLYARYAAKAELFRATVLFTVEQIGNRWLSPAERGRYGLAEGLMIYGRDALRISLEPLWSSYERLIFSEGARFPELTAAVADRVEAALQTVSQFIGDCAQRSGEPVQDAHSVAAVYVMALRGFYTAAILSGQTPSEEEIEGFVANIVRLLLAARANW